MTTNPDYRFKRLVVVSYRLPFKTVYKENQTVVEQSSGGLVSAIHSLSEKMAGDGAPGLYQKVVWVGKGDGSPQEPSDEGTGLLQEIMGKYLSRFFPPRKKTTRIARTVSAVDSGYQLVPVTIDPKIDEKYYGGFCNDSIWPLFHYFASQAVLDESYYENYAAANRLFAEKIRSIIQPDDFIWVHDYQLFLLPGLLREQFPSANIGFFLHIPFPTFEVFRILPRQWREALLRGMLGADLVGFHTYDFSQYFLRTVSRLLGYEITMNSVLAEDRVVRVDAFPLGIDFDKFHEAAAKSREVGQEKQKVLATLKNQKLIFSIDRLDYSKGLLHRLEAFEFFLETYPEWIGQIVFNMVVIPSRDTIARYQEMKREIEAAVGRINGKYSTMAWRPIIYQYKSLSFNELVALYDLSLVGLITPIRDGMNLVAKEYVACQITEKGVLILSEMAGAAAELGEALLINPTDRREVADALNRALAMPLRDRTILISRMQKRIKNYTVFSWAKDILDSLEAVKKEQEQRRVHIVTPAIESEILDMYRKAVRRVIFLDYDGTLVPFSKIPELAVPGAQTINQLKALAAKSGNSVVLISGRDKNFLEEWFGNVNVNLIAEHGAFKKLPAHDWQCAIDPDQGWKATFMPVLQRYSDRCNGSFIEEKFSSLAWHYRNVQREVGLMKANELKVELRTLVAHENKLHVLEGDMVVEVKRTGFDKGIAVSKFIADKNFDFIMALGDDRTDEDIFRALPPEAVTIKIGITTSMAKYNLKSQVAVSRLIGKLIAGDGP